ncbi:MAG: DUF547 domain-containing protein, partial [bacterium]|nr:DUF547 domain-containing protein [bacterium]
MSNLILTLALWISVVGHADAGEPYDYGQWQQVLTSSVDDNGRVDYAGLKADPTHLDAFVARLAVSGPDSTPEFFTTKADSFAFWLNAYNAMVVSGVVEAYPVASVKDISLSYGFFKRKSFRVDRRDLTLDDIEHGILRPGYRDPRIHAAINCGAKS